MYLVTDEIRAKVKQELKRQELTISSLAEEFNVSRPHLSRLINRSGKMPREWKRLLDRLGLELTVKEKEK